MDNPEIEVAAEDRPLFAPRKPALRWGIPAAIVAILAAAGAAYYFWQQRPEAPVAVQAPAAPPAPAPQASTEPRIEHPIEAPSTPPAVPLPALAESDSMVHEALASIFGATRFDALFRPQDIVRHVVATIDNLPHRTVPRARTVSNVVPASVVSAVATANAAMMATDAIVRMICPPDDGQDSWCRMALSGWPFGPC